MIPGMHIQERGSPFFSHLPSGKNKRSNAFDDPLSDVPQQTMTHLGFHFYDFDIWHE